MLTLNHSVRIVIIEMSFDLIASFSLKDKRRIRQRLLDKLKREFNLSIIESGLQDDYLSLELTASYVAIDENTARIMLERIHERILDLTEGDAEPLDFHAEIL